LGRSPLLSDIGLDKTKVILDEKGFVKINEACETTDRHILAIGDITGPPMLAHRASRQGKVAAEVIAGKKSAFDNRAIPSVVYSDPEVAMVGITEDDAIARKLDVVVGKAPYSVLGRAVSIDFDKGYFKVIADAKTTEILGMTICGKNASDMIGECALAMEMGAFLEDVAATIHPHPTFSEGICEACENALGKSIHVRNR
jgi:dihydrolipoamide dehydrogenase